MGAGYKAHEPRDAAQVAGKANSGPADYLTRSHQPPIPEELMATAAPTSQFAGVDFLNFDNLLSEEERAVRDTVPDGAFAYLPAGYQVQVFGRLRIAGLYRIAGKGRVTV